MPNSNYSVGEFVGLSYLKVCDLILSNGWSEWESIEPRPRGAWPYEHRLSLFGGRGGELLWYATDPQTGQIIGNQPRSETEASSRPCSDLINPEWACPGAAGLEPDTLLYEMPVGLTGLQLTDGSNMLILGHKPGSDKIEFSKSWYHATSTDLSYKIGLMVVKGVLASVTSGVSAVAIAAFEAGANKPTAPIHLDIPDESKPAFQPVDVPEIIAPVQVGFPGDVVGEFIPEPANTIHDNALPVLLALGALLLFGS